MKFTIYGKANFRNFVAILKDSGSKDCFEKTKISDLSIETKLPLVAKTFKVRSSWFWGAEKTKDGYNWFQEDNRHVIFLVKINGHMFNQIALEMFEWKLLFRVALICFQLIINTIW